MAGEADVVDAGEEGVIGRAEEEGAAVEEVMTEAVAIPIVEGANVKI